MKKIKYYILTFILLVVCITVSTYFNKKTIKYTFFYNNGEIINLYSDLGNKLLKEDLIYFSQFNGEYALIVNRNNQSAIINKLGNFIINYCEYDKIEEYGKMYLAYKGSDVYLITANNTIIRKIENKNELITNTNKNYCILLFDNKYHVFNSKELIFEFDKINKKRIGLKETGNYGLIVYDNSSFVFSLDKQFYKKYDNIVYDDIIEEKNVLLVKGKNNRIIKDNKELESNYSCDSLNSDEYGNVYCGKDLIYENDNGFIVKCEKKCELYKNKAKYFANMDDIQIKKTNNNTYFITKKDNVTTIYNEEMNKTYITKKSVRIKNNYIVVDNKNYTFEGNEIIL